MSTIKDVAQYTGLSIATISKYLNGGNVLEENRARIANAIEHLDYRVNLTARSLKTRRTMTVGTLLPSLNVPFFSTICEDIERNLRPYGYSLTLCSYYDDPAEELAKLHQLLKLNTDSILLVPQYITKADICAIRELRERETPLVLMDRYIPDFECDRVLVDNISATYTAIEQLITSGHRRIGLIIGPVDVTTAHERLLGYERVLHDYAIPVDPQLVCTGDYSMGAGHKAMNRLFDMENPPTAVMSTNHEMTMGAITAAYERKKRIPDDISFIGYDEIQLTKVLNPPVSIVLQPVKEIAKRAAELLLLRMRGDYTSFPQIQRLKAELIPRQSVKQLVG